MTSQHPILSTAVRQSLSAYSTSKSYSPSFKYGAEFVERHIGSPVVNTVETASRISGVETGVRWWLQRRNSTNPDRSKKRRRPEEIDAEHLDVERGLRDSKAQTNIQESFSELTFAEPLPAYDDNRSPSYEEKEPMNDHIEIARSRLRGWQQRIIVYTSGLGVSLSEESLRSLRHCLEWLRWANQNINNNIRALHEVLDKTLEPEQPESSDKPQKEEAAKTLPSDAAGISQYVNALDQSVRSILKEAISVVNRFAGNALPDNARELVRKYITSFPLSFRIVNTLFHRNPEFGFPGHRAGQISANDARTRKAILFAREGLNMLAQITIVLDGTIASADRWVDRLERRGNGERENVGGDVMNSTLETETMDEIMAEGVMNDVAMNETMVIESGGNEIDLDGGVAIRTSAVPGTRQGKGIKSLKSTSRDGAPVNRAPRESPRNGTPGGSTPRNVTPRSGTPRNGPPRGVTPRRGIHMNGTSANGSSTNGSTTNDVQANHASTNGNSVNRVTNPWLESRRIRSPLSRRRRRLRARNPNNGPSPTHSPRSSPVDDILVNGAPEDENQVNGSTNGVITEEIIRQLAELFPVNDEMRSALIDELNHGTPLANLNNYHLPDHFYSTLQLPPPAVRPLGLVPDEQPNPRITPPRISRGVVDGQRTRNLPGQNSRPVTNGHRTYGDWASRRSRLIVRDGRLVNVPDPYFRSRHMEQENAENGTESGNVATSGTEDPDNSDVERQISE